MDIIVPFLSGIILFNFSRFFPFTSLAVFVLSVVFFAKKRRLLLALFLILGFAYAFARYSPAPDPDSLGNRVLHLECVTEEPPRETFSGRLVNEVKVLSAADARSGEELAYLEGREMNIVSDEGLPYGLRIDAIVTTGRDMDRRNPGMAGNGKFYAVLNEARNAEAVKESPLLRWLRESREGLHGYMAGNFRGDSAAFLAAVTIGKRSTMSPEMIGAFNSSGLAHLLSISGTHFGLFSALLFGIIRLIVRSMPYSLLQRFTLYLTPSQAAAVVSLPFILFYLFLSGAGIPALRSFIMVNVFLLGLLAGRKGFWLNSLVFAAFLICLWDPSAILSLSFQLSFLAVLCIGLSLGDKFVTRDELRVADDGSAYYGRFFAVLRNSLLLSVSASLGTAPLVAYSFHYFSLISPLANLIITPFIGFILVPLALASSFIFIFTGYYPLSALIAFVTDTALSAVNIFASMPSAEIKIPAFPVMALIIFYTGLLVFFTKRLSTRVRYLLISTSAAAFSGVVLSTVLFGTNSLSVTYLDVGQGDSAVIEGRKGEVIAIDTGRTGRELEAYLRFLGKRKIDALVITHADDDHSAGLPHVMKRLTVRELWDNGLIQYPEGIPESVTHRVLERGDETDTGGLIVQVLHPYDGFFTFSDNEGTAENNDSLVIKVTGGKSFLFTGDVAEEAEDDMLHLGSWIKSDVLKVSHHGSSTSTTEDFLNAVSPRIAVISVGRYNPYGHPHRDTMERLKDITVYRTDRDGAVKIVETSDGIIAKTYKDFKFEEVKGLAGELRNIKRLFMRW